MTDAVRAALRFAFGALAAAIGWRPPACRTMPPSQRVLEKVGFTREGRARRYLKINGQWQDHDLFALLQDDPRG